MNDLLPVEAVQVKDGKLVTTSLVVAEVFGKRHADVLRDIEALECSEYFRERNFALAFRDVPGPKNSTRQERYFDVTRDGFTFLAMGYRGKKSCGI
jgi:Rha family phage regulatory protein